MGKELNYEAITKKLLGEELTESEKHNIKEITALHEEAKAKSLGIDTKTLKEAEKKLTV